MYISQDSFPFPVVNQVRNFRNKAIYFPSLFFPHYRSNFRVAFSTDGAVALLRLASEAADEAAVEVCIDDLPVPREPRPVFLNNLRNRSRFWGFSSDIFSSVGFDR